jgi:hypothetical protein
MSTPSAMLDGFAYGEHLEGLPPRSLGYRLLAPPESAPWGAEVEALARRLQGAPYPDHWPPTDLFCSVLLADGRRLIAVARYGLADHTPTQRRGGLELIGAVGPGDLDVASSLAVYRWLQARRFQSDNLHALGGRFALADALAAAAPAPAPADPVPVLPIRLWQEGALLFAATAPSDPDHRLGLLEQGAGRVWQWLPLVGPDFPLAAYAQRGSLVAWAPHLTGVAVKVDRKPDGAPRAARPSVLLLAVVVLMPCLVAVLIGATLWQTVSLRSQIASLAAQPPAGAHPEGPPAQQPQGTPPLASDDSRSRFADALHDLLRERMGTHDWEEVRPHLIAAYERAARQWPDLRLKDADVKSKEAVGAVMILSGRSADRIDGIIHEALTNKGYDAAVIKAAAERVRQQLLTDLKEGL